MGWLALGGIFLILLVFAPELVIGSIVEIVEAMFALVTGSS